VMSHRRWGRALPPRPADRRPLLFGVV